MKPVGTIYLRDQLVGDIILTQEQRMVLSYEDSWKSKGFAISHSLPLSGQYSPQTSHNFFSNLLPEGSLRDLICQKLGISPDNVSYARNNQ